MDRNQLDELFKSGLENFPTGNYEEKNWDSYERNYIKRSSIKKVLIISLLASSLAACLILVLWMNKKDNADDIIVSADTSRENILNDDAGLNIGNIGVKEDSVKESLNVKTYDAHKIDNTFIQPIRLSASLKIDNVEDTSRDNNFAVVNHEVVIEVDSLSKPEELVQVDVPNADNLDIKDIGNYESEANLENIEKESKGSFSIIAALDMTGVKGASEQKISENVGLLYTYPLNKKISLSTGVMYSWKKYNSPYNLYNPKVPYVGNPQPNHVQAVCDILSVPIAINYHLISKKSYDVVLTSGLSSFFMLKENYSFLYSGVGFDPYNVEYTIKGKNNHFFGAADFSISINKTVNNKFSMGIRPFYQIPLTGFGYGRTQLQSKGVAISFGLNRLSR